MRKRFGVLLPIALAILLAGCGDEATVSEAEGIGPTPKLPPPHKTLIPTFNVAPVAGWSGDGAPTPAQGLVVRAFARDLAHPRQVIVLPNGDVLVAETAAPPKPDDGKGIKGMIYRWGLKRAGSAVPSANRITLLRDQDGDGVAETRSVLVQNLNSPYGMALVGDALYVANTDAVVRYPYTDGDTRIDAPGEKVVDLPAGTLNHHWTKNLVANPEGTKLYVSVGSNSNVAENGLLAEEGRASIWEIDLATKRYRTYASGLRNPNGLAWEPVRNVLWTAVNERDEIGSDLVPDYMTAVKDGGFYGWPYSYFGQHPDARVKDERPDLVQAAIVPDYALGAHTASLGLAITGDKITGDSKLDARFASGAFVGQHGSWNRKPLSGYKVIFVPFADGKPNGPPIDVLTGFLDAEQHARGRPVGVALDGHGGLLVADDVGNTLWRVTAAATAQTAEKPR
jgi:glucose/arabinose dehydrogenase